MKKYLTVLAVAGVMTACNTEEKKAETTTVVTEKPKTDTVTPVTTTTTTTTATTVVETPKFADADVQKLADEYTSFVKEAVANAGDATKTAEYQKKATDWAMKMQPAMQKLASKPEELKKWTDYMQKLATELQPK